MNHALISFMGGGNARAALTEHTISGKYDKDYCARGAGCKAWKKTKAGRERFERLGKLMREHDKEKSSERPQ